MKKLLSRWLVLLVLFAYEGAIADPNIYTKNAVSGGNNPASGITIGTSVITGGTDKRVLFDDAGVVGESAGLTYTKSTGNLNAVGFTAISVTELAPALTAGNWTVGSGWESPIVGPGLIKNADGTGTQTPSAATNIVAGTTYKVTITLSALSVGSATYTVGGVAGASTLNSAATFTDYVTASTTGKLIITPTNTSRFTISAISILAVGDYKGTIGVGNPLPAAFSSVSITAPTATTGISPFSLTQTRNAGAVTFPGVTWTFTDTAVGGSSNAFQILGGATGTTNLLKVDNAGITTAQYLISTNTVASGTYLQAGSVLYLTANGDTAIGRGGANQIVFGGNQPNAGAAVIRAEINKFVTAIANNTATATATVTIPNGNHSAGGRIAFKCAAGAGGAIGADEFSAYTEYEWVVARTTGVNAVATLSAAVSPTTTASVAGGATPTLSVALSAISGAVGASNTFTFNVTVNALTGSSTNHTCFVYGTLINDNASGVTIL